MSDDRSEHPGSTRLAWAGDHGSVVVLEDALAALRVLPDGVVIQQAGGEISYCNPAAERLLGLHRDQMTGKTSLDPIWRVVREDGSPFPGESHPSMVTLATGKPVRGTVMGVHRPDGTFGWISIDTEPIPGENGRAAAVIVAFRDVTDRKREAERAAAERESFRRSFENSEEAILLTGPNGAITAANPAACRMFGRTEEEIRRIGRAGLTDPSDPRLPAAIAEREQAGLFRGELNYLRSDGTTFPGEVTSVSFTDAAGSTWISTNLRDITDRRRAEEALRRSEEDFRYLFENSIVGQSLTLPSGEIRVNDALARLLGYEKSELAKMRWQDVTHPDDLEETRSQMALLLSGRQDSARYKKRFLRRDGSVVWVEVISSIRRDGAGKPLYFMTNLIDITEQRRSEEALRASEERYRALADSVTEAIFALDSELRYTYWNRISERNTGLPAERVLGASLPEVFPDARGGRSEALYREVLRTGQRGSAIERYEIDGEPRVFEVDCYPSPGGVTVICRDVSERERAAQEIQELNFGLEAKVRKRTADLESALRELEGFSYSVSHDLRAPLRAIEGFAGLLARDAGDRLDPEDRHRIDVIRANVRTMSALIDDLLTFSRMGRHEIRMFPVPMGSVVRAVFEELTGGSGTPGRVDFRLEELPDVDGDPAMLRQVWVNLLSNALKFSGQQRRPTIEVSGALDGGFAVYRVRDNGVGFDGKYTDKLFGVFQRLHGVLEFEGTGIGLALVKRIVERHGGRVWAEGKVGGGATFSFSLPATRGERAEAALPAGGSRAET